MAAQRDVSIAGSGSGSEDMQADRALLFERYAPYLTRVLSRQVGRDQELCDLLHDVFVAAFESIHRLEHPQALPAFLKQIAVNVARTHIRRSIQRRALVEVLKPSSERQRPHLDHAASEARAIAGELLGHLPLGQRAPLSLRFLAEMELSEVAAACRLSVPTVKRRLAAARRKAVRLSTQPPAAPAWAGPTAV
jgi:RNA polymerase sigma-70 factor (ECF subfamily)